MYLWKQCIPGFPWCNRMHFSGILLIGGIRAHDLCWKKRDLGALQSEGLWDRGGVRGRNDWDSAHFCCAQSLNGTDWVIKFVFIILNTQKKGAEGMCSPSLLSLLSLPLVGILNSFGVDSYPQITGAPVGNKHVTLKLLRKMMVEFSNLYENQS